MDNRRQLLLFLVLLFVAIGSYSWIEHSRYPAPHRIFSEIDTSQIESLHLSHPKDTSKLHRKEGTWMVNERYKVDPFILRSLFQILQEAESRRLLSGTEADQMKSHLSLEGCQVRLSIQGSAPLFFSIGGEAHSSRSYLRLSDGLIHEISLPGQANYLAPLFFLREIQWRTRLLFYSHASTLRDLRITYPNSPQKDLHIEIRPDGPHVDGLRSIDSLALYEYLASYELFYTNEYIEKGQVPSYDSLLQQPAIAYIAIDDLYDEASQVIAVYDKVGDPYFLLQAEDSSYSLCERRRLRPFLVERDFFIAKQKPLLDHP